MPGKRPSSFAKPLGGTAPRRDGRSERSQTIAATGSNQPPHSSPESTSSSATDITLVVVEKGTLPESEAGMVQPDSEGQGGRGEEQDNNTNTSVTPHSQPFTSPATSRPGNDSEANGNRRIMLNLALTSLPPSVPQITANPCDAVNPDPVHIITAPRHLKRERKQKTPYHTSQITNQDLGQSATARAMADLTISASTPKTPFAIILKDLLTGAKVIKKYFKAKRRKADQLAEDAVWFECCLREQYGTFVADKTAWCGYRRETVEEFLARTGREMGSLAEEEEVDQDMADGLEELMAAEAEQSPWRQGGGWGGNDRPEWALAGQGANEAWVGYWREEFVQRKREKEREEREGARDVTMEG